MSKVELIDKNELWAKRHAVDDYGREPYVVDAEDVFYAEVIKAVPLDKIKQAREKIWEKVQEYSGSGNEVTQAYCDGFKDSLAIIDKLIESEEK